nr:3'(2'),5'-bisphosphate nucleotidase CysQ [uncultured Undibacterium sp.]
MNPSLDLLLPKVVQIAIDAGAAILDIYQQEVPIDATEKSDRSPLTIADLTSHEHIVAVLRQISDLPILSEESSSIGWSERSNWTSYWLIDPLDGTKEFIKRNGEFTVNIALIEDHVAVMGVVYAPVLQVLYCAAKGLGAQRVEVQNGLPQVRQSIHVVERTDRWRVIGSRSHGADRMNDFMQFLGKVDLVAMGSSLKLCLVAEGVVDLYPRLAPTSEWDTAAAQCVVEQAGGLVLTEQLQPLLYNSKESILNPHFIVCACTDPAWTTFFEEPASVK